ncbi:MAG: mechanosensitive ion channel family protein [Myxococcota bacterium]
MKRIIRAVVVAVAPLLLGSAAAASEQPTVKSLLEKGEAEEAEAGEEATAPAAEAPMGPVDEFDRGVPRTALQGYLGAADAGDWERATEYLDLRNLPRGLDASQGPELARQLKVVLDRALWIDHAAVSADAEGHADDGLPAYRDHLGRIELPGRKVDLLLQRVRRDDGVRIWKFSNVTVAEIPGLYASHGFGPLGERLSRLLPERRVLGVPVWEWVGVVMLLLASFVVAWLATRLLSIIVRAIGGAAIEPLDRALRLPFLLLVALLIARSSSGLLGPTVGLRALMEAHTLLVVVLAWFAIRVTDELVAHGAGRLREAGRPAAAMLGNPLRNFVRGLVVLVAVLVWLDGLGYEIGTVLAGLGIGGIAIALAAQRSVEDLIGAFTILSSQPVRIGDFCRFGDKIGTVEEVSLRATRVRTLDDTVVSVPNGEFAKLHLENYGRRRKIWYRPRIRLRYETTPEQIRFVLVEVRKVLYAHPRVLPDPARIRFVGFGDWSLDLDVFAYVDTTNYGEYLEVAEDLNLRIMQVVVEAGTGLAVPAQRNYAGADEGPDDERRRAAEAQVAAWREQGELYLPSFPEPVVDELSGSLPYPPEGAPKRR